MYNFYIHLRKTLKVLSNKALCWLTIFIFCNVPSIRVKFAFTQLYMYTRGYSHLFLYFVYITITIFVIYIFLFLFFAFLGVFPQVRAVFCCFQLKFQRRCTLQITWPLKVTVVHFLMTRRSNALRKNRENIKKNIYKNPVLYT